MTVYDQAREWLRDYLYELHTEADVHCADSGLAKLAAKRAGINSRALAVAVSKIATVTRLKGGYTCWKLGRPDDDDDISLWL